MALGLGIGLGLGALGALGSYYGSRESAEQMGEASEAAAQAQVMSSQISAAVYMQAMREANALTVNMYHANQGQMQPWMGAGQAAIQKLLGEPIYGDTIQPPGWDSIAGPGDLYQTESGAWTTDGGGPGQIGFYAEQVPEPTDTGEGMNQAERKRYLETGETGGKTPHPQDVATREGRTDYIKTGGAPTPKITGTPTSVYIAPPNLGGLVEPGEFIPEAHQYPGAGLGGGLGGAGYGGAGGGISFPPGPSFTSEPYREITGYAGGGLMDGPGDFEASPGYEFRREEGLRAIEQSRAARGLLESGGTMQGMMAYGQGLASEEYSNFLNQYYQSLNPWLSMAGMGQMATGQSTGMGTQMAGSMSQNVMGAGAGVGQSAMAGGAGQAAGLMGAGQASAYGTIGAANSFNNMLSNLAFAGMGGGGMTSGINQYGGVGNQSYGPTLY